MLVAGKKCWVESMKKKATKESIPRGGKFFAFSSTAIGNDASTYNNL
jgi:hypothetical protein